MKFDIVPLTWVKHEIDLELALARQYLDQFSANPADRGPLGFGRSHLHQVTGVLRMLRLEGPARVLEDVENLLGNLAKPESPPNEAATGAIGHAIAGVSRYLQDLTLGEPDLALRLLPPLRELRQAQGGAVSESELFFPDIAAPLPPGIPRDDTRRPADVAATVRAARGAFQKALLGWLRAPADPAGLQGMLAALASLQREPMPLGHAALWWIGGGFLDGLQGRSIAPDMAAKQACGRIEQDLRHLGEGAELPSDRLLRDLLYHIARARPVTERMRSIQAVYDLAAHFPAGPEADRSSGEWERIERLLDELREHLAAARQGWVSTTSDHVESVTTVLEQAAHLRHAASSLKDARIQKLVHVIGGAAQELNQHRDRLSEPLAMEVATAFLLLESGIENYPRTPPEFGAQVEAAVARVRAAALGNWDESQLPRAPRLDEASRRAYEKEVLAQVAHEVQANLGQAEQVLDAFFRDHSKRTELPWLDPLLRQVHGMLEILGLERAQHLLDACRSMIARFADPEEGVDAGDLDAVAGGLSGLGFYVDSYRRDPEGSEALLEPLVARLAATLAPHARPVAPAPVPAAPPPEVPRRAPAVPAAVPVAPGTGRIDQAGDPEMLEVYLDEADEVLASAAASIQACLHAPSDRDSLAGIRRGFHTLKGSGRMVGLQNMGAVAWAVEQVMNQVLETRAPATPELLELLQKAHDAFHGWVVELRQSAHAVVEAGAILDMAKSLGARDVSLPGTTAPPVAAAPITPAPAPEQPATITVGDVVVDATLFRLFADEAQHHLATLAEETERHAAHPGKASDETIRAVHTLAGISRATGFRQVAEVASGLESVLKASGLREDDEAEEAAVRSRTLLGSLLGAITVQRTPSADDLAAASDLVRHLQSLADRARALETQPVVPITIEAPEPVAAEAPELPSQAPLVEAAPALPEELPPEEIAEALPEVLAEAPAELTVEAAAVLPAEAPPETAVPVEAEAPLPPEAAAYEMPAPAAVPVEAPPEPAPAVEAAEAPVPTLAGIAPAEPAEDRRRIRDDVDPQLLPIFLEEAAELLPLVGSELRAWRSTPDDAEASRLLRRTLHTLKGSARMAGAMRLGELTHHMEGQVEAALEGVRPPDLFDRLESAFDRLGAQIEGLQSTAAAVALPEPERPAVAEAEAEAPSALQAAVPIQPAAPKPRRAEPEVTAAQPMLRVRADLVDRLVNDAGEVSIARSRIEAEMYGLKLSLADLTENISRLRGYLREVEIQAETQMQTRLTELQDENREFDPLEFDRFTRLQELTRMMAESVNDVSTIQQHVLRNLDESEKALNQQARMGKELQQELLRVRAVPFGSYSERFYRVVRQAARDMDRKATIEIRGEHVELDRGVLERVTSPIEHMLRNAVAHGIESPAERAALGKPEAGRISLTVRQEGNEVAITLADDGAGLNLERIRRRAVERGLVAADAELSEAETMQFIFSPGFSTAQTVTQVSGRGVGMDVVRSEVTALGGRVEVASKEGQGTTFSLVLPLTLAVAQVVLVTAAGRTYAVPSAMVEQVRELRPEEIDRAYAAGSAEALGNEYPFFYLPRLLDDRASRPEVKRYNKLLFLRWGASRIAIHVDDSSRNQEVVVKNIGPQLAKVPGIDGATVLGNGLVVLIINPVQFSQREELEQATGAHPPAPVVVAPMPAAPLVMVVDDSVTVRKVTTRLLTREGYEVVTAKDGLEAMEKMQEVLPDLMLVDIEMPRMDGFDLTRQVRANERTKRVPIIMITSRTAEKHRRHAQELGVNAYLGKPYNEEELLQQVRSFVAVRRAA